MRLAADLAAVSGVLTDAEVVNQIRRWLSGQMTDHMLGLKVRLLIEDRAAQAAEADATEADPPAYGSRGWVEFTGGAVVDLPDEPYGPRG
jgi:hypothetical protein